MIYMKMEREEFDPNDARIFVLQNGLPEQYVDNIERTFVKCRYPYIRKDAEKDGQNIPVFIIITGSDRRAISLVNKMKFDIQSEGKVIGKVRAMMLSAPCYNNKVIWTSKHGDNPVFDDKGNVVWD